jgi:hypothetical protein
MQGKIDNKEDNMFMGDVLMGIGAVAFSVAALAFTALFLDWIGMRHITRRAKK